MPKKTSKQSPEDLVVRGRTASKTFFDGLSDEHQRLLQEIVAVVSRGGVSLHPTAVRIVSELGLSVTPSTVVHWLKREAARNGDSEKSS